MNVKQTKLVDEYDVKMLTNGLKTNVNVDEKEAKEMCDWLYSNYTEKKFNKLIIVDSPDAAIDLALKDNKKMSRQNVYDKICFVNWWTHWVAYYHAGINILNETDGVEQELIDNLNYFEKVCNTLHGILFGDKGCIVIKHPIRISLKDNDVEEFVLSDYNNYAVEYKDGSGRGFIDGIRVPDYIVKTSSSELVVKKVISEENVDVRRVGLNKIGTERAITEMNGTVLDTQKGENDWDDYTLLEINFGDKPRKLLKMFNPQSKSYEFSRVDDGCNTILDAMRFRNSHEMEYIKPTRLT